MKFDPTHPDYQKFSDVYADESSQTKHRYLLLGGLIIPTAKAIDLDEAIQAARLPELPSGEMAWVKVSRTKYPAYQRVVDVFFDNAFKAKHLDFHCLFVDTHRINNQKFNDGSKEIGFNKEIYQIFTKCRRLYKDRYFHCYPDKRSTNSSTDELRLILNRGSKKNGDKRDWPFRRVMFRDSSKTPAIQLVDILLGAVAFKINGHHSAPDASPAKKALCDHILRRAGVIDPIKGTTMSGKFTVWQRTLK